MHVEGAASIQVGVAFSPRAGEVDEVALQLLTGATVLDAIVASGLTDRHPSFDLTALQVGVWGARCERSQLLRDGDRVELYRPLLIDPMEARRRRQAMQRESAARVRAKPTR